MTENENIKSGILQGAFICRTSEFNPRILIDWKSSFLYGMEGWSDLEQEEVLQAGT